MSHISSPHDAKAGPTKAEVRATLLGKLALGADDHFVEVGSCTGAVTIEAARRAGRDVGRCTPHHLRFRWG